MRVKILAYILLAVACYAISHAAPGTVTVSPGTAFTTISGNGGKFRATANKSPIYFQGSSVTVLPGNVVRISGGTGGTIDTAVLDGKLDKITHTQYSTNRQAEITGKLPTATFEAYTSLARVPSGIYMAYTSAEGGRITRYRFEAYTSSVKANYATGSMLSSHNTATASHDGHFINTSNPHNVTGAQVGLIDGGTW